MYRTRKERERVNILLGFVLVIFLFMRYNKTHPDLEVEETNNEDQFNEDSEKTIDQQLEKEPDLYTWIKKGTKGVTVKKAQMRMNMYIDYLNSESPHMPQRPKLKLDGIFGNKTEFWVEQMTDKKGTNLHLLRKKYYELVD